MPGCCRSSDVRGRTDGIVKARFVDPDYRRRMDIDDMLAALRDAD